MPSSPGCPEALRLAVLELLGYTLVCIRTESSNAQLVLNLADHAHNLPALLSKFHPDLLAYYWETERPCFLRNFQALSTAGTFFHPKIFQPMWKVIEQEYLRLCKASNEADDKA